MVTFPRRGGRLCPPLAGSAVSVCKTIIGRVASMVVGRGDLTPPPYNETIFVHRIIPENRENSGSPAGRCGHRPLQRNAVVYRNWHMTHIFLLPNGGVRSPRPTNGSPVSSAINAGGAEPRPYARLPHPLYQADRVVRPYNEGAFIQILLTQTLPCPSPPVLRCGRGVAGG